MGLVCSTRRGRGRIVRPDDVRERRRTPRAGPDLPNDKVARV